MVLASVVNQAGAFTSSVVLSKNTVHRQQQLFRKESAQKITEQYCLVKSVVHWDGKLLPDVTGEEGSNVDRLPVLLTSLEDGSNKLLAVLKLASGSGKAACDAIMQELTSWECTSHVIGTCFDTTASNTGSRSGCCALFWNSLLVVIFSG